MIPTPRKKPQQTGRTPPLLNYIELGAYVEPEQSLASVLLSLVMIIGEHEQGADIFAAIQ